MNIYLTIIIGAAISYLLGSIPFGLLISRIKGIDIRKEGSGNIGATNVFRCVGKSWGIITFVLDVLKGFISAFIIANIVSRNMSSLDHITYVKLLYGFMAIAGHNWPVFLKFKGGKGVATTVGAILGIIPGLVLIGLIIWLIVFLTSRYVSLASILTAIALAVYVWSTKVKNDPIIIPVVLTLLALLIIWRHKANIKRLLNGNENRFDFKKKRGNK